MSQFQCFSDGAATFSKSYPEETVLGGGHRFAVTKIFSAPKPLKNAVHMLPPLPGTQGSLAPSHWEVFSFACSSNPVLSTPV